MKKKMSSPPEPSSVELTQLVQQLQATGLAYFGTWEMDLASPASLNEKPLRWSDEVFRIFGYKPGEIEVTNEIFFNAVHPDDRERITEAVGTALSENKSYAIDHRIILPDGTIRFVHEAAQIERDPGTGRPLKMKGIVQDITERREKEEALRLSEERFAKAFEYAPIGKALVAPDGRWLKVNRALCHLIGYREEELLGKTFQDITHPDDLEKDLAFVRQLLAGEIDQYQMEKRYFHKQGHVVWVQLSVTLVLDAEQRPLYFVSQIQDITEQKAVNQKLAEQAALIDEARDAIILHDLEQVVLFWSKGAERLYGWQESEAKGRKITDLVYRKKERLDQAIQSILARGTWFGELEHVTKAGELVITECRWTLLRDANNQPKSILVIHSDMTERKRIERQFLRAQRMESIGTLAGGIAHDLNNLLAPIVMGVELLKQFGLTGQSLKVVESIEQSAKRGSSLVRQVLSFARGDEGARVAVHARDVIHEVESMMSNTFPKNIAVETKVAGDLWLITGDPTQINQVLLNLCVNSRDAMPAGGKLTISAKNCVIGETYVVSEQGIPSGQYILIKVKDTGCGIPNEIIEKIFDPFFTTKELSKGTGLGLATTLGIVRSHGGYMNVVSEPGQGSTFKVYLPAQVENTATLSGEMEDGAWPKGNGEWILLVEDEASIRSVAQETLESYNYHVLPAVNGAEAVSIFALNRDKIALVLTDTTMPVMDGPATIVALRQIDPQLKIVAASGLDNSNHLAPLSRLNVKHFLSKPYTMGAMLTTLKNALTETS